MGREADGAAEAAAAAEGWESVPPPQRWLQEVHGGGRRWEVVSVGRVSSSSSGYDYDDFAIFPPCDHEGLQIQHEAIAPSYSPSSSYQQGGERELSIAPSAATSSSFQFWRDGYSLLLKCRERDECKWLTELGRKALDSGFELVYSRFPCLRAVGGGEGQGLRCLVKRQGGVWQLLALFMMLALLYLGRRHRREKLRLLLLIQEKDQKIGQLLDAIAQKNEAKLLTPSYLP